MATIHLICGFLGAGKTTFSHKLVKEVNAILLNPDEWCMKLYSPEEYETNWNSCFDKTVELLWQKAGEYIAVGKDIVFDMGFWSKRSRDTARLKALELNAKCILYYVYAPDQILKERLAKREGVIAKNNLLNFDNLKKSFEEPQKNEEFILIRSSE